jgi:hypothetical protein
MKTHYLIDHNFVQNDEKMIGEFGHLLAFNPGDQDADLKITFYFEDQEPKELSMVARAGESTETNYSKWPVKPGTRFAIKVESTRPIACQSTVGWNVTLNDYGPHAKTRSPLGIRETAKSYMSITALNQEWFLPDGIVIDMPDNIYVRESEWALILNPGDQAANVTLALHYKDIDKHSVTVPARRLKVVYMDEIARRNSHYGVHFMSDQPVAIQWLRSIAWYDRDELMGYWSVPCVPGPLEG